MDADPPGSIFSSVSYIFGACNFLAGSIAFIPQYYEDIAGQYVGGLCYTVGSFCFCIADIAILYLLIAHKFPYIDRICLLLGSLMYVVGSSLFIPDIMEADAGDSLFIAGSTMILGCRIWLYSKTRFRFPKVVILNLVFEMLGALSFLVGPAISLAGHDTLSVALYILGSISFITAAIFNLLIELINAKKQEAGERTSEKMLE